MSCRNIDKIKVFFIDKNVLSFVGGIIFVAIFMWSYSRIDNDWYQYRDDGVITMSVAKNLVDYGFIGASPSGPRVEASSSPMQFWIYALTYFVTRANYIIFSYAQTIISTFLIGFLFARFFSDKPVISIIVTTISAIGMTFFYPFFEWHASGMENAITHVLFLATVYTLYTSIKYTNINYWASIIVFMATISRIDSVYHISILLIIYSIYWFVHNKKLKAFYFSLIVFFLWTIFQLWRYYYFGDILPNTAYAQNINVMHRLNMLLNGKTNYIEQSLILGKKIFMTQAGWLIYAMLPLLYFFKQTKENFALSLFIILIVITSCFTPFLFGTARIDFSRTTTQMTLFVFLLFSTFYYSSRSFKNASIILATILPITIVFYNNQNIKPYYLGWSTDGFNNIRKEFLKIARENDI